MFYTFRGHLGPVCLTVIHTSCFGLLYNFLVCSSDYASLMFIMLVSLSYIYCCYFFLSLVNHICLCISLSRRDFLFCCVSCLVSGSAFSLPTVVKVLRFVDYTMEASTFCTFLILLEFGVTVWSFDNFDASFDIFLRFA